METTHPKEGSKLAPDSVATAALHVALGHLTPPLHLQMTEGSLDGSCMLDGCLLVVDITRAVNAEFRSWTGAESNYRAASYLAT